MRTVTALDVRRKFGQIVDEAAAGERIVIERAGQPVAAIVPLADLALVDPDRRKAARLAALDDLIRMARRRPFHSGLDAAEAVRAGRAERDEQIRRAMMQPKAQGVDRD
jgi:prevent-host-death family protein